MRPSFAEFAVAFLLGALTVVAYLSLTGRL
jgi:hypothetical protein